MTQQTSRRRRARDRRGSFVVWLLIALPIMLLMLLGVTGIGSLWLARAELSNLADATALAGAKVWGDGADDATNRTAAHLAAQALGESNTILGVASALSANNNAGNTNNNDTCPGTITLGRLNGGVFAADQVPLAVNERACRAELTTTVTLPFLGSMGVVGPFTISASSVAYYDGVAVGTGTPRLTLITSATCP
jgi:Flp pilus assembly protein TadG